MDACIPAQAVAPANIRQAGQPACATTLGIAGRHPGAVEGFIGAALGRQEVDERQKKRHQGRRLLADLPTLKPQLASATWVGGRRWDLNFQSGETVALPEGERAARAAIAKFAGMDKATGLLGRGIVRFDLRVPGKMIVRLPRAPGEAITGEPAQES